MDRTDFDEFRAANPSSTTFGSITEVEYFPSVTLLSSPEEISPMAIGRHEKVNVAAEEGTGNPEIVGVFPLGEAVLSSEEVAALEGFELFWTSLRNGLRAKAQAAPPPPPPPPE
jgi:hypothetical protein